jgi:hypothetical protein
MRFCKSLLLIVASICIVGCVSPEQSGDVSDTVYQAPDRLSNQRDVQELHNDILRQDF